VSAVAAITVVHSAGYWPERRYAAEVLLGTIPGLPVELIEGRVAARQVGCGGATLVVLDVLFRTPVDDRLRGGVTQQLGDNNTATPFVRRGVGRGMTRYRVPALRTANRVVTRRGETVKHRTPLANVVAEEDVVQAMLRRTPLRVVEHRPIGVCDR